MPVDIFSSPSKYLIFNHYLKKFITTRDYKLISPIFSPKVYETLLTQHKAAYLMNQDNFLSKNQFGLRGC